MKKLLFNLVLIAVALTAAMTVVSCDDDDDDNHTICPSGPIVAIGTLKTDPSSGQFYIQLNDSVTLVPVNIKQSPYGNKEVRAEFYFTYTDSASGHYARAANVALIDTIRTKPMSPALADLNKAYGNDPVEVIDDWTTVCEDGYLTLRFRTYFGGAKVHSLYLVRTGDNTVELHHNANGDIAQNVGDGIIAFRLNDMPNTNGEYKTFTLKWNSFSGPKSIQFRYKSRN